MWKKFLAASAVASGIIGLLGAGDAFAAIVADSYTPGQEISLIAAEYNICVHKDGGYAGDLITADIRGTNYEKQIVFGDITNGEYCTPVGGIPADGKLKYVTPMGLSDMTYVQSEGGAKNRVELNLNDSTMLSKYLRSYGSTTRRIKKSTYEINFDANGGTGTLPAITGATVGSSVTLPKSTLVRDGYRFAGWNTKADGTGTPYADEATITVEEPGQIQLFAQWVATTTTLDTGQSVNAAIKTLAAGSSVSYVSIDTLIKKLEFVDILPDTIGDNTPKVNIALSGEEPVYAYWVANEEKIYINTEADIIYANSDSSNMFYNMRALTSLTLPTSFNTANVTSMIGMFSTMTALTSLTLPESFNTANVTNMFAMFSSMSALTSLNLPTTFNTANVTDMYAMFAAMRALTSLTLPESFNTANVTNMNSMFAEMEALTSLDLPTSFNTANVTNMSGMFNGTEALTSLTLPTSFNTANVTSMSVMFSNMLALASLTLPDTFVVNSGTTTTGIFDSVKNTAKLCATDSTIRSLWPGIYCSTTKLQSGQSVNAAIKTLAAGSSVSYDSIDALIKKLEFVDTLPAAVNDNTPKVDIALSGEEPVYAYWVANEEEIYINTEADIIYANSDSSNMFYNMRVLTSLTLPTSFDTANVTSMGSMFYLMQSLTSLTLPTSFNTANVTDMHNMFAGMLALTSLDLPASFDTANVTNMRSMFNGTQALTSLTLPTSFNTANVTDMTYMFTSMLALTSLTLPTSFNTANVTNMGYMFYNMQALTSLTLPASFNTAKVTDMRYMFRGMTALTSLTLPTSFNTANVTDMSGMFWDMQALASLTLPDTFVVNSGTRTTNIFASVKNTAKLYATDSTVRSLWPGVLGN